jgi:hypothetical protein
VRVGAAKADDSDTVSLAERILEDERTAARRIEGVFDEAAAASLVAQRT